MHIWPIDPVPLETAEQRFWPKVSISDWWDCWLWKGALSGDGSNGCLRYGAFRVGGRIHKSHRVSYTLCIGPIPDGLTVDHVAAWGCSSPLCCNPLHLEAVTLAENVRRGGNARKIACKYGHPLRQGKSQRHCPICDTAARRRYRENHRG